VTKQSAAALPLEAGIKQEHYQQQNDVLPKDKQ
jgi:hypothetical protein